MPELPEVEVVRLGLAPAVTGATVLGAEVFDARSLRRHDGPSEDFVERMSGALLEAPRRRGKFLWVPITASAGPPAEALSIHLGMSGQVLLREPDAPRDRLTRVLLQLRHPDHDRVRVDFVDQRIFGSMTIEPLVPAPDATASDADPDTVPRHAAHIARDPLDPRFDDARFLDALARKRTAVKRALLDQTLLSGVGNIYADESLWMARVHPEQPTETLSRRKATELLARIREVFGQALAEGGTSFDAQYLNVNGESGYFSRSLKAYGREGEPCLRCGRPIRRVSFTNRSSHFCPRCQQVRLARLEP